MASFASSATTGGARKHAWTNNFFNDLLQTTSLEMLRFSYSTIDLLQERNV